jgi:hypothetical protein
VGSKTFIFVLTATKRICESIIFVLGLSPEMLQTLLLLPLINEETIAMYAIKGALLLKIKMNVRVDQTV